MSTSLHRLVDTPARYGWVADFAVIDVRPEVLDELAGDDRLAAVTPIVSSSLDVDGERLQAYAQEDGGDRPFWTVLEGRLPAGAGEVVLSPRAARRLGLEVGDRATVAGPAGARDAAVVGLGVGPVLSGERADEQVLANAEDLSRLGAAQSFRDAMVQVAPGHDPAAVADSYAGRYELSRQEPPGDVANLEQLGALPEVLAWFMAAVAGVALVHALVVSAARRRRDLAVLRAMGLSRRQVTAAVTTMAAVLAGVGLLVGVPLGAALGRLVWWLVADAVGVATDTRQAVAAIVLVVPVMLAAAVVVAWWPARRLARQPAAAALRAE